MGGIEQRRQYITFYPGPAILPAFISLKKTRLMCCFVISITRQCITASDQHYQLFQKPFLNAGGTPGICRAMQLNPVKITAAMACAMHN